MRGFMIVAVCLFLASCAMPEVEFPYDTDTAWWITSGYYPMVDYPEAIWKSPSRFEEDGGGDCEDFATYMIYLLGPKTNAQFVMVKLPDEDRCHAAVELPNGSIIEPQVYHMYHENAKVILRIPYEVLERLTQD